MSWPPIPFADPRAVDAFLRDRPNLAGMSIHTSLAEAMYRFARSEDYRLTDPAAFKLDAGPAVALATDGTVLINRAAARQLSALYAGRGDEMIVDRSFVRARLVEAGIEPSQVDAVMETFKRPTADTVDLTAARIARQHKPDPDAA